MGEGGRGIDGGGGIGINGGGRGIDGGGVWGRWGRGVAG